MDKKALLDLLNEASERLKAGQELPEEWIDTLFPAQKKEYELRYAGKERVESILADVEPLPLQEVARFQSEKRIDDWTNKLIFGDNLQVLKRLLLEKEDGSLVSESGIPGVKMVYIDPPFSTERDFKASGVSEKVYQDKIAGAKFLEWLRKRLVILRELLANDGSILVHLDYRKGHYVKVLMDEIFGENNFVNEIIWGYRTGGAPKDERLPRKHDVILWYRKTSEFRVNPRQERQYLEKKFMDSKLDDQGRHYVDTKLRDVWEGELDIVKGNSVVTYNTRAVLNMSNERTGYPTQKPEGLLSLITELATKRGDLVLDCFSGSGTTAAVAERLSRRWISCDVGKFAIYTQQKRLINLRKTTAKSLSRSFALYNVGLYDFSQLRDLSRKDWSIFASQLFNFKLQKHKVKNFEFDGYRHGNHVYIFDFHDESLAGARLSRESVQQLHDRVGNSISGDVYIVGPSGVFDFMEDYISIGDIRYYSLRIPYSFINDLHKRKFSTLTQPRESEDINSGIEAVGFDFIQTPDLEFELEGSTLVIKKFQGKTRIQGDEESHGWESFSMLFVDYSYEGEVFSLDDVFYASQFKNQSISLQTDRIKREAMLIFLDKFGNEARRIISFEEIP